MERKKPFFQWINAKNRLSFRDGHTDKELWYMHISPLNIFSGILALVLVLFVLILTLVAYTPILDFIPGYPGNRSREILIANIMRLDSMERQLQNVQIYSDNMALILEGKMPVTRGVVKPADTSNLSSGRLIPPSREDSILRLRVEASARAVQSANLQPKKTGIGMELLSPVSGVVTNHFNPKSNHFGVEVATTAGQQVAAVADGTVVFALWTPGEGYIIQVQHSNNLLSVYRHCAEPLKTVGSRVRAGEVISYTAESATGGGDKGLFQFELWYNGAPADPESYILFR